MKVVCINDSNKPSKISKDQWVKKGQTYTVIRIVRLALQNDKLGLILKEIKLDKSCFPYEFYDSDRFTPVEESLEKEELVEELVQEADLESIN